MKLSMGPIQSWQWLLKVSYALKLMCTVLYNLFALRLPWNLAVARYCYYSTGCMQEGHICANTISNHVIAQAEAAELKKRRKALTIVCRRDVLTIELCD